jgi:uncharacterized membrane protein
MPVIIALFQDTAQAQSAEAMLLKQHTSLQSGQIGIVSKGEQDQISFVDDTEEQELRWLSTIGRVTGWIVGVAGAVVGAPMSVWQSSNAADLAASDLALQHDTGLSDDALRHVGEHLQAGSTAIVVLTRQEEATITATLESLGGTIYQGTLPAEIEAELTSGDTTLGV